MASSILDDLVHLIGHQHAIELLRAFGGRRLKVPADLTQDHPLAFTVGLQSAKRLAAHYGGTDVDLPAERNFLIDLRNDAILIDFKAGHSISALAMRYGVSRRQVNSILDAMGHRDMRMGRAATRT